MSGRNAQVARVLAIFEILAGAPQGLTIKEIHRRITDREHDASERTIYRDLDALQRAGFPVHSSEESEDRTACLWRVEKTARINEYLVLSPSELLALYLARGALTPLEHTPIYQDLDAVFRKIESKIGTKNREYLDELATGLYFDPWPQWGLGVNPATLDAIRAGCAERHILEIDYESASGGERRVRKVGPQFLYYSKGSLYLIAEDLDSDSVKTFALPRIKNAAMLDVAYEGTVVDPDTYFQKSLGVFQGEDSHPVTIEFSRNVASYVRERSWHASQRIEIRDDGSVLFHLNVAITPDLLNWIMGFGADAVVIEPTELRRKVVESAEKMLRRYSDKRAA